ncbi:MAG: glycosyltransferase [Eubacteriales bacterium]
MKNYLEKEKNFISAVVYLRNCTERIIDFMEKVDAVLSENFCQYEFILVDDNSEDDTLKKVNSVTLSENSNMYVVKMAYYHGKEKAMRAGIDLAIGDFVFEFDSTLINYELSLIYDVYLKSLEGYDVVAASQNAEQGKRFSTFYKILEKTSENNIKLKSETFRVVSRRMINRSMNSSNQVFYRKAIYHNSGLKTCIINYDVTNDKKVNDSLKFSQQTNMAMDILVNHSDIGTRIAGYISIIFLVFAIITTGYTVYTYLTLENIQPGWATTMFFLSISFTGVFLTLYIITKYLVNILLEVRNKPMYVYKSVEKLKKNGTES